MDAYTERIVLDPHALVLALTARPEGNRRVLEACLRGDLLPAIGGRPYLDQIEDMVNRAVVRNRCPLPDHDISKLLDAYLQSCEWVHMHKLWRPDVPERTGLPLLELAEAGGATTLIAPSPHLILPQSGLKSAFHELVAIKMTAPLQPRTRFKPPRPRGQLHTCMASAAAWNAGFNRHPHSSSRLTEVRRP